MLFALKRRAQRSGSYNREIAPYRQPVLIYNPVAGKLRRNPEAILQRTRAALARGGLTPRLLPTSGPHQAGELARRAAAEGADLVLILGGDGTINEVVQGLAHSGVPLGVLPGGTANVLAMEIGLGSGLERAAEMLGSCRPVRIALGRITSSSDARYFLLMCGAGLDAAIVSDVHAGFKAAAGKLAYWAAALKQFRRSIPALQITLKGETFSCGFALISRVRNYGGDLEIASGASLLRDDFEVVLFDGANPLRYAWYMLGVAAGQVQKLRGVRTLRARHVAIRTAAPLQIDGELFGHGPATLEIEPAALTLLIPPTYG